MDKDQSIYPFRFVFRLLFTYAGHIIMPLVVPLDNCISNSRNYNSFYYFAATVTVVANFAFVI